MLHLKRIIISLLLIHETASSRAGAIVDLSYAKYQGEVVQDQISNVTHTQFLGIRFAAPPTGAARFRAPLLPTPISEIQQGSPPPLCFQASLGTGSINPFGVSQSALITRNEGGPEISEDCLFLNVFVPDDDFPRNASLPVLVWIYGGGYVQGGAWDSGFTGVYNGNDILRRGGERLLLKVKDGGVLNAGLLDQQFALQWVQNHISKFGGDPRKVTIWGESAGAGSVLQQVVANGGKTNPPLFRAAITSSTYLPPQYRFNDPIPEAIYNEIVAETNCNSATDTLNCLRQVNADVLGPINFRVNDKSFFGTNAFVPVIDGTFIKDRRSQLLKGKKVNGELLYSVTNSNEGTLFVNPNTTDTVQLDQFLFQFFPTLAPKYVKTIEAQYSSFGSNYSQAISIVGDWVFICPTYQLLSAFGGKGYKTEFAITPAAHGEDINYYFPGAFPPPTPPFADSEFLKAFTESFTNFAISLNPNNKWENNITPSWALWKGSNEMVFNKTEAGAPDVRFIQTSDTLRKRCGFWESITASTSQ